MAGIGTSGKAARAMQRDLLVLRHAHADSDAAGGDFERALSAHGRGEARAIADRLALHAPYPDVIICSPARRARMTAAAVLAALAPAPPVRCDERIYGASVNDLLEVIESATDASCLLLVGHNPGLERLVAWLCHDAGGFAGFAPATLVHVRLRDAPGAGRGRLLAVHAPQLVAPR